MSIGPVSGINSFSSPIIQLQAAGLKNANRLLSSQEAGLEVVKASTPNYNRNTSLSSEPLTKDEVGLELVKASQKITLGSYSSPLLEKEYDPSQYFKDLY